MTSKAQATPIPKSSGWVTASAARCSSPRAFFIYRGYFAKPTTMASRKNRSNLIVLPSAAPGNIGALAYLAF